MPNRHQADARKAAELLANGTFVVTAHFEGRRAGIVARAVAVASDEPLLIAVTLRCGHWIEPLIRDSRHFGICRVDDPGAPHSALLLRKCGEPSRPRDGDIFDPQQITNLVSSSPILTRSGVAFDCEVTRHIDLEADHELYVGRVLAGRIGKGAGVIMEPKPSPEHSPGTRTPSRAREN